MPEAIQKKKNKNKNNNKDDEDEVMEEEDKTLDRNAGPGYSPDVQRAMNEIGDSGDVPFDLISDESRRAAIACWYYYQFDAAPEEDWKVKGEGRRGGKTVKGEAEDMRWLHDDASQSPAE